MEQKQRYCGDCASYIPGGGYPNCIAKRAKKNIITKHEKTDFGDVWYMTSEPEGIFRFAIYRYDDDRDTIYLSNVFVGKEHRKNGLGNIILNAADKVAKKLKANTICLKVKQDSFVHDWYGRHGYTDLSIDEEEPQYIWMSKSL